MALDDGVAGAVPDTVVCMVTLMTLVSVPVSVIVESPVVSVQVVVHTYVELL